MTSSNISCIILAGGKGQRMGGADKGLMPFKGKRLIEYAIENISSQVDDIVISANRNLAEYRSLGYAVYTDQNKNFDGPLAGMASTIPHCRHDWILVIPCDMPLLPENLVSSMLESASGKQLVVISAGNQPQLILLLHCDLLASIQQYLAGSRHSAMQWVASLDHQQLEMAIDRRFGNINTPEQLDR
jgi:molybdopterin-guanine dinucleotide biosynthesis protein A